MAERTYEFGWRGFRLQVPEPWEPGHLEGDDAAGYVRFDDALRPRLELKWSRTYREDACDLAFQRYLRELIRARKEKRKAANAFHREPRETSLVSSWPDGMRGRTVQWSADVDCVAAVVACSECSRVSGIQVLFPPRGMQPSLARRILESFRDHVSGPDAPVLWALYRMRFQVPRGWRLTGSRFGPGYAEMHFAGPDDLRADVRRWGPAEVTLWKRDIVDWYLGRLPKGVKVAKEQVKRSDVQGDTILTAAYEPKGFLATLRRRRSRAEAAKRALALQSVGWHCPRSNRLWMVDVYARTLEQAQAADWQVFCHEEEEG